MVTTTAIRLHPENETRIFSLAVTDTQEQTKNILYAIAEDQAEEVEFLRWHALQIWLEGAETRVAVPYARQLAELIPPIAVRLRRDFTALLNLIKAHAFLHQQNRGRNENGFRIYAWQKKYA